MSSAAQLTVTSGPDRGRVFDLSEELVHIGTGAENQIALSDPSVAEHQASIVSRGGRYAIFTPLAESVDVDGDPIPADQWVWLPQEARIKIGDRTALLFESPNGQGDPAPANSLQATPPVPAQAADDDGAVDPFADDDDPEPEGKSEQGDRGKGKRRRKRKQRPENKEKPTDKRQVAKFVTDQGGDTVVTLGEDGQLPELQLREGATAKERRVEKPKEEGTSPAIYAVLGFSVLFTVALLVLDFEPGQSSRYEKSKARETIRLEYIGGDDATPKPYQRHLRDAMLARQRGDFTAERNAYRRTLDLLNAEDNDDFLGLTGNPRKDEDLRKLLGTLLSR